MSLYKDASLVMIPTAYKDGKLYSIRPTDGSGDFTFSRGSNLAATRVDVNGLIEKGRENIALHSDWDDVGTGVAPTGWATFDPNFQAGAETGQIRFILSSNRGYVYQNISLSVGVYTFSFYCDSVTTACQLSSVVQVFGSATKTSIGLFKDGYAAQSSDLIEAGSRYAFVFNVTGAGTGQFRVGAGVNSNDIADITLSRPQVELGLAATDYIETGATSAQAGILEDLPRLDYSASCPSLLLEPQRLNKISHSEYFGDSSWNNSNAVTRSISTNSSPEGKLNAYDIIPTTANSNHTLRAPNLSGFISGAVVNVSFFAKANGYKFISVVGGFGSSSTPAVVFNLDSGSIVSGTGTIEDYGNGWYRCVSPITLNATALYCVSTILNDSQSGSFAGDGTSAISVYGFQIEEGSYPTSYIPTMGSAVTRSQDIANLTDGIPNMIGANSFTFFYDCILTTPRNGSGTFTHLDLDGIIGIKGASNTSIRVHCVGSVNFSTSVPILDLSSGRHKFAITLNSNGVGHYFVDGVKQTGEITYSGSGFVGDDCKIDGGAYNQKGNQLLVFPTALTDSECIALTTI